MKSLRQSDSRDVVSRRTFVKYALASSGIAAAGLGFQAGALAQTDASPSPNPMVTAVLGRTGVQVSRLGIGCGMFRMPFVTTDIVGAILHQGVELGVTYVDTAPDYGSEGEGGYAEIKMGPAIREIRDKVFLVTKTEEAGYEGTWRLLRQSLERLQTDHLDLVHIHSLGQEHRFPDLKLVLGDQGALGALREAKKQGVLRFIGVSGHSWPSRFHAALDTGEFDVVMNPINFVVRHTYNFEDKVWSRARHENLGLVAMKVLGGTPSTGRGYRLPESFYQPAVRYALSVPDVACAVIGMTSVAELEQAARTVAQAQPLSRDEHFRLVQTGLGLAAGAEWQAVYGEPLT